MIVPPQKLLFVEWNGGTKPSLFVGATGSRLGCALASNGNLLWDTILQEEVEPDTQDKKKQVLDKEGEDFSCSIRTLCKMARSDVLVVLSNDKTLRTVALESGNVISMIQLRKRAACFVLTADDRNVLIADKFGDVWRYDLSENGMIGQSLLLLGHLSPISDIALSKDEDYVITCDKDEHIRVSHYPQCFDIEAFCQAHQDFIASIVILNEFPHVLLSASCDGAIHAWKWKEGTIISHVKISSLLPETKSLCTFKMLSYDFNRKILIMFAGAKMIVGIHFRLETGFSNAKILQTDGIVLDIEVDDAGHIWVSQLMEAQKEPDACPKIEAFTFDESFRKAPDVSGKVETVLSKSLSYEDSKFSLSKIYWMQALRKK